jgi:ketosteroid isomerase-like protein
MRTFLYLVTAILLLAIGTSAQKTQTVSALSEMVATERAFAKTSEDKGTRDAFMMFIADDGILFRPGPVMGKRWMQEHPVVASDKRPLLAWQPIFAEMSAAGDLGYTFGPWEFKSDIKDEKAAAYGHFATIWKKQTDGTWRFAIDLGISHPDSAIPAAQWQPEEVSKPKKIKIPTVDVASTRESLSNRDREFSKASEAKGVGEAFGSYAAENIRLFRNGHVPFAGKSSIAEALRESQGVLTWQPTFSDVSRSGDLGYTYGVYELRSNDATKKLTGKGNYMRFWKKQDGVWKVVLDVEDPRPVEEKKS